MTRVRVQEAASRRIDEIYLYSRHRWGTERADTYITGLFESFDRLASDGVFSRPIPVAFEVHGYCFRYERHYVYWKILSGGDIGIVTILHERMHQMDRFRDDLEV